MAATNEAAIRKDLNALIETITASPLAGKSTVPISGVYHNSPKDDKDVGESICQLQLQVKYLLFDLEATRRENRYLRQMLENRHRRHRDNDGSSGQNPGL